MDFNNSSRDVLLTEAYSCKVSGEEYAAMLLLGVASLSYDEEPNEPKHDIVKGVEKLVTSPQNIVDLSWMILAGLKKKLPNAVKRGLAKKLSDGEVMSHKNLVACDSQKVLGLVIKLTRPKPETAEQSELFERLIKLQK